MKRMTIVLFALTAILMLIPATKVGAVCPEALGASGCFENKGYRVEIVPDDSPGNVGLFPKIEGDASIFKYKIARTTSNRLVSFVNLLIPASETPLSIVSCNYTIGRYSGSCTPKLFGPGSGDPLTGFGLGLTLNQVIRLGWTWPLGAVEGTVTLKIAGKAYAAPNASLLVAGLASANYPFGQILTPSSSPSPTQDFGQNLAPQVPLTTFKRETIFGVEICTETEDTPGYPTKVYTCNDPTDVWPTIPLSQVEIMPGTLLWIGDGGDARYPQAYIVTEGSTCVQICNKYTGVCKLGPRGCTPAGATVASVTSSSASRLNVSSTKSAVQAVNPETGGCQESGGCTISGWVLGSGDPVANRPICVRPTVSENPVTSEFGNYSFSVPQGWSGTVAPTGEFDLYAPLVREYTYSFSGLTGQDFELIPGDLAYAWISGRVYTGISGQLLNGVVMYGLPCAMTGEASYGGPPEAGYYYSQVQPNTLITVTPKKDGYTFDPPFAETSAFTNTVTTLDFTAIPIVTSYTISGRVTSGEGGLSGVLMSGLPEEVRTDEFGYYTGIITGTSWTGEVKPILQGYTFSPLSRTYTGITTSQAEQDYMSVLTPVDLVPRAVLRSDKVGNVASCDQFEDGILTSTFSCQVAVANVCDCEMSSREYWEVKLMGNVSVTAGKLQWVGSDSDPTNPTSYLVSEGSTCVQKCNMYTGLCRKYPAGCTP